MEETSRGFNGWGAAQNVMDQTVGRLLVVSK